MNNFLKKDIVWQFCEMILKKGCCVGYDKLGCVGYDTFVHYLKSILKQLYLSSDQYQNWNKPRMYYVEKFDLHEILIWVLKEHF